MSQSDPDFRLELRDLAKIAQVFTQGVNQSCRFNNTSSLLDAFTDEVEDESFANAFINLIRVATITQFKDLRVHTKDILDTAVPSFYQYLRDAASKGELSLPNWDRVLSPVRELDPMMDFPGVSRIIMAYIKLVDQYPDECEIVLPKDVMPTIHGVRDVLATIQKQGGYDYLTSEFFARFGFTEKASSKDDSDSENWDVHAEDASAAAFSSSSVRDNVFDPFERENRSPPIFDSGPQESHSDVETPTTPQRHDTTVEAVYHQYTSDVSAVDEVSGTNESTQSEVPSTPTSTTNVSNVFSQDNPTTYDYDGDTEHQGDIDTTELPATSEVDVISIKDVAITPLPKIRTSGSTSTAVSDEDYEDILAAAIDDLIAEKFDSDKINLVGKKMQANYVASLKDFEALINAIDKVSDELILDALVFLTKQVFFHLPSVNDALLAYWKIVTERENPLTKVLFDVDGFLSKLQLSGSKDPEQVAHRTKNFAWLLVGDTGTALRFAVEKALQPQSQSFRLLQKVTAIGEFKWQKKSIIMNILQDVAKTDEKIDDVQYYNLLKILSAGESPLLSGDEVLIEIMRHLTKPDSALLWVNAMKDWVISLQNGKITVKWNDISGGFDNPAVTLGALVRLFCRSKPSGHNTGIKQVLQKLTHVLAASDVSISLRDELFYENSDWIFKFCAVELIRDLIPRYLQEVPQSVFDVIPEDKRGSYRAIRGDAEVSFEKYLTFVLEVLVVHDEIPDAFVQNLYSVYPDVTDINTKLTDAVYTTMDTVAAVLDVTLARSYFTNLLKLLPKVDASLNLVGVSKELAVDCQGLAILAGAAVRGIVDVSGNKNKPNFNLLSNATKNLICLFSVIALQLVKQQKDGQHVTASGLPWVNYTTVTPSEYLEKYFVMSFVRTYANCIHRRIIQPISQLCQLMDLSSSYLRGHLALHPQEIQEMAQSYAGNTGGNGYAPGPPPRGGQYGGNGNDFGGHGGEGGSNGFTNGRDTGHGNGFTNSGHGNGFHNHRDGGHSNGFSNGGHGGVFPSGTNGFNNHRDGGHGNGFNHGRNGGYNNNGYGGGHRGNGNGFTFSGPPGTPGANERKILRGGGPPKNYAPNTFNDPGTSNNYRSGGRAGFGPRSAGFGQTNDGSFPSNDVRSSQNGSGAFSHVARNNPRGDADGNI